jgi:hypothetical protein
MVRELGNVVETLRLVQASRKRFLELWSVEKDYINPMLDRMADDLARVTSDCRDEADDETSPENSETD